MKKQFLFTPGPTPIPPESLLAMANQIDYHRSAEAVAQIKDVSEKLKHVFQTQNDILILTASGTGAMESVVANILSLGDEVIVIRSGKFGERWGEICSAYGVEFYPIDLEWGESVEPQAVADLLDRHPNTKAVFSTLCETSTGALHDIKSLGEITRHSPALLVVDAVSALGADDLQMDRWGIDVVVSCSHKGLMTPPGLAFAALNQAAWEAAENASLPKYYFDLRKAQQASRDGSAPYTPAITFIGALQHALNRICSDGITNVIARHAHLAKAVRSAVKAIGLNVFAVNPANTLTSIRLPEQVDGLRFVRMMREKHGITFAGGQGKLRGKIVRIAHLGWMDEHDLLVAIAAIERGMMEFGQEVSLGAGVSAAQEVLLRRHCSGRLTPYP